jgi:hypothetical protein
MKDKLKFLKDPYLVIFFIILAVHIFLLTNLYFTAWPEMTFWPYLMLKGWLPYKDIAIAHNPLLLITLTVYYKLFGMGILELQNFTWITIILTDILVYFIATKLLTKRLALISLVFYVLLQSFYEGNGMWFDLFLTPLILLTYFSLFKKKFITAGIFFAMSFLVKQTAAWFFPIIIFTIAISGFKKEFFKNSAKFLLSAAGVLTIFLIGLLITGLLPDYYYWAFKFGIFILPSSSGQIQYPSFKHLAIYLFAFLPLVLLFLKKEKKSWLIILWTLAGLGGLLPRFELFHFQPALPFLGFTLGLILSKYSFKNIKLVLLIFIYSLGILFLCLKSYSLNFHKDVRFYDNSIIKAATELHKIATNRQEVYIINAYDNLYQLSNTVPATRPWYPHLAWYMDLPGVQDHIVTDLQEKQPLWIITTGNEEGLSAYQPEKIYRYIDSHYSETFNVDNYKYLMRVK